MKGRKRGWARARDDLCWRPDALLYQGWYQGRLSNDMSPLRVARSVDPPELEMGSFQDSLVGCRKEAARGPLHYFFYSLSLLLTACELQKPGSQGLHKTVFEGLGLVPAKPMRENKASFVLM